MLFIALISNLISKQKKNIIIIGIDFYIVSHIVWHVVGHTFNLVIKALTLLEVKSQLEDLKEKAETQLSELRKAEKLHPPPLHSEICYVCCIEFTTDFDTGHRLVIMFLLDASTTPPSVHTGATQI